MEEGGRGGLWREKERDIDIVRDERMREWLVVFELHPTALGWGAWMQLYGMVGSIWDWWTPRMRGGFVRGCANPIKTSTGLA